jgi:hypothetical protein
LTLRRMLLGLSVPCSVPYLCIGLGKFSHIFRRMVSSVQALKIEQAAKMSNESNRSNRSAVRSVQFLRPSRTFLRPIQAFDSAQPALRPGSTSSTRLHLFDPDDLFDPAELSIQPNFRPGSTRLDLIDPAQPRQPRKMLDTGNGLSAIAYGFSEMKLSMVRNSFLSSRKNC